MNIIKYFKSIIFSKYPKGFPPELQSRLEKDYELLKRYKTGTDPRKWDYCPYGYGTNLSESDLWTCRCGKKVQAMANSRWIGEERVCPACKIEYEQRKSIVI